jgi:signal transduction histidine kinase
LELRRNRATITLDLETVPELSADRNQLQQVCINLIRNAEQALEDGGVIRIRTRAQGGEVEWTVEDSGVGLDPALYDKIFQPLFTTKADGTGLGLALVKQIVVTHGGQIKAEKSDLGGLRVCILFPHRDKRL